MSVLSSNSEVCICEIFSAICLDNFGCWGEKLSILPNCNIDLGRSFRFACFNYLAGSGVGELILCWVSESLVDIVR